MKRSPQIVLSLFAFLLSSAFLGKAQVATGGNYKLEQSVVAGGGGISASGGSDTNTYSIEGTIGQSVAGGVLDGSSFTVTSGFWNFTSSAPNPLGFEADIASRPLGDSLFGSDDLIQLRLFLNGGASPDAMTNNEFQRADSAPYSSRGDGALCSNDLIQLRRYLNGADTPQTAGGPTAQTGNCGTVQLAVEEQEGSKETEAEAKDDASRGDKAQAPEAARELRVESPAATSAGQTVTVNIRVDALGDEAAYSFRLNHNQTILTNPVINDGTTGAAIVDCDTTVTDRIGCTVEAFPTNQTGSGSTSIREIGAGDNQLLLSITFTVATNAVAQTVPLTLSNVSTSNDRAQNLVITATSGAVTVAGATAAPVSIGGRVITGNGRGIRNVQIAMIDSQGKQRTATSTAFGYYRFDDVVAGETITLSVKARQFRFDQPTIVRTTNESISDADFVSQQ